MKARRCGWNPIHSVDKTFGAGPVISLVMWHDKRWAAAAEQLRVGVNILKKGVHGGDGFFASDEHYVDV
jgi:hypothetical protein